ncbi:MAG: hypothetical protein QNJ15_03245, partial [Erythrobacter sp.]|nr:hypothetical protein [Erythrobacter sp.]
FGDFSTPPKLKAARGHIAPRIKNADVCAWLQRNRPELRGLEIKPEQVSALRNHDSSNSPFLEGKSIHRRILTAIQSGMSAGSLATHLLNLRFANAGFYPLSAVDDRVLEGVFGAKRFSFVEPGKIAVSAFRFRRDDHGRPFYEEKRRVEPEVGTRRQLRSFGSWHMDRNAFTLAGFSMHVPEDAGDLFELPIEEVDNIQEERFHLHDDGDSAVLSGLMITSVRKASAPAATEIVLERIDSEQHGDEIFDRIQNATFELPSTGSGIQERIGVREPIGPSEVSRLKLRKSDPDYSFVMIRD